ncbi:putative lipid-transfer protein DIR1 [Chenopodium quinoa]|uniref:Bifunctional inhibitor/plant lipid transfer protein/seed storage helical domain-containing protein n=1 Tax=Chenopodium quinoa TaxID=63459 RepID=A0A803MFW5_CHEQI|nr:putative lipid-transfer protein DIR1 [Chenopodium quinoa]
MAMRKAVLFLAMMVAISGACNGACNLNVQDLMTCKPAVATSNPTSPSPACCNMVKGLNADDIQCLCNYKNNQPSLLRAFGVDPNRCTQLPAMCNLSPINC